MLVAVAGVAMVLTWCVADPPPLIGLATAGQWPGDGVLASR
jgi:hypothetical protein